MRVIPNAVAAGRTSTWSVRRTGRFQPGAADSDALAYDPEPIESNGLRKVGDTMERLTDGDMTRLPLRARIAFAARCARRVAPFVRAAGDQKQIARVRKAIWFAEAVGARHDKLPLSHIDSKLELALAFGEAGRTAVEAANTAAYAAHAAAESAREALGDGRHPGIAADERADDDAIAALYAAYAGDAAADAGADIVILAQTVDYRNLLSASKDWTDDTPVAPEFFGGLWPGERPSWSNLDIELSLLRGTSDEEIDALIDAPCLSADTHALEITIEVPDETTDDEIDEIVYETVRHANAVHRAAGGGILVLDSAQAEQLQEAEL